MNDLDLYFAVWTLCGYGRGWGSLIGGGQRFGEESMRWDVGQATLRLWSHTRRRCTRAIWATLPMGGVAQVIWVTRANCHSTTLGGDRLGDYGHTPEGAGLPSAGCAPPPSRSSPGAGGGERPLPTDGGGEGIGCNPTNPIRKSKCEGRRDSLFFGKPSP